LGRATNGKQVLWLQYGEGAIVRLAGWNVDVSIKYSWRMAVLGVVEGGKEVSEYDSRRILDHQVEPD